MKILTYMLGFALGMAFLAIPVLIVWLIYNHVVAPLFAWPLLGFWKVFLLLWLVSIVRAWFWPANRG